MRAVFLTQYFPPEVGAPQTRIAELGTGLARSGVDVTVHTGFPHYPEGRVLAPYRNRPLQRERTPEGVAVVRSAVYPAANRGFGRRLAGHLSLAASALATAPATRPADVVVVESPPLFLAAGAVPYAALKRAALVVHVADLWPASAVELGALRDGRAVAAAQRLERWIYAAADAIVVPTRGMEDALERHPAAAGKVVRIGPAVDAARFAAATAAGTGDGPLRVLYAGTVGMAHGLETLVEAARIAGPDAVEVTIAGQGAEWPALAERVRREGAGNVTLLGAVPAAAVPQLYARSDAGVVLLRDRPIFAGALPTKLLECMAAGRPVVLGARGEAAALVRTTGAGLVVEPEDPVALADAFRVLSGDPARRTALATSARAAAAGFTRAATVKRWAALLEDVAAQRARR